MQVSEKETLSRLTLKSERLAGRQCQHGDREDGGRRSGGEGQELRAGHATTEAPIRCPRGEAAGRLNT